MSAAVARRSVVNVTHNSGPKNLRALLAGLTSVVPPDIGITDITLDSRKVIPGGAFVALPGLRTHGISFAAQAVNAGASAVLWEPGEGVDKRNAAPVLPSHIALVAIPRLSSLLGAIADRFFDSPSQAVAVAGVTGTNGKTTTAYVLAAALARLGKASAYAGTLGYGRIEAVQPGTHTTPDSITVHRQIAELRDAAVSHLGMEISSHALDQHRIDGVRIDTAIFTNLTHDHLDYHGTFEAYGAAKTRLFAWPDLRHAVINVDDAFGRDLAMNHSGAMTLCSRSAASLSSLTSSSSRYLLAREVTAAPHGLEIDIDSSWGSATLTSRLVGDFNVDNLLAVLGVLLGWGFPLTSAISAIQQCVAPPGRMETFTAAGKPLAIVDYAHTPDALEKALLAARAHCSGKLICVFGCGGDRDTRKRPVMGAIAERLADLVIVTDDNPRTEDGDAIVAGIIKGLRQPQSVVIERDRARAIERAIHSAHAGDTVLVAGKGHEDYQIVGLETRYFSDRDVVQAALRVML